MNKITNYMVTQTGARRTVTFTVETYNPDWMEEPNGWTTKAVTYSYGPREPMPTNPDEDAWQYTLPSGETYSHPNKHGCLHMILQDAIGDVAVHRKQERAKGYTITHNRL